jgi:hypothetical protein
MHSLYRCLHNCSMQIYVHICALTVYCTVNAHVYLTAYYTSNISETLHNALPTLTPHWKHSSQRPPCLHCAPAMKPVTAQIPRYVMAFVTAHSKHWVYRCLPTTQCTGHTDAATMLLTFRLQAIALLLAHSYAVCAPQNILYGLYVYCYNFLIHCSMVQTVTAQRISYTYNCCTDLSVNAEHADYADI